MNERTRTARCVDYTLGVLLGDALAARCREAVAYGPTRGEATRPLWIVPSGFFGPAYGTPASLPVLPLREVEGVPLLFGAPCVRRRGTRLVVHADIVASAYFLLTRYEEMVRRDVRDAHGRFPGTVSLPFRAGFIDRPIVDDYAALLRQWLREVGVDAPEPSRRFSVLLTHDVDVLRCGSALRPRLRAAAAALVRRSRIRTLAHDPFDSFDEIARLDAALADSGVPTRAAWFFMAGGHTEHDGRYQVTDAAARRTIRRLRDGGAEIGLHASYEAGLRPELIAAERAALEEAAGTPVRGNRHHYLGWRETGHGRALAAAGIAWDSTLGYPDVAGFRLGTCRPVPLFDPARCEPLGIQEHPLAVMDATLSSSRYMGLGEDEAMGWCYRLIDQTRRHGGELVLLWHNTAFAPWLHNYHPRLYRRILAELAGRLHPARHTEAAATPERRRPAEVL